MSALDSAALIKLFLKAAEKGSAPAQFNLGLIYKKGLGVTQDYAEAFKYLKAAEKGDADAQFDVGRMYFKGLGVTQDYVQAYAWFSLVASRGNKDDMELRDLVKQLLTISQFAEAQALAREWAAKYNAKE